MGDDHRTREWDMQPMLARDSAGGLTYAPQRHRWTLGEVEQMLAQGLIRPDDRLELVEGELLEMSPKSEVHSWLRVFVEHAMAEAYAGVAFTRGQEPLSVPPDSLPEPDIAVVRGGHRDYLGRHPGGADCLLVVEVAVTSLAYDRHKTATYARGGVPVVWILDVDGRRLEIYTDPRESGRYGRVTTVDESEEVDLPGLDLRWVVASLLPPLA